MFSAAPPDNARRNRPAPTTSTTTTTDLTAAPIEPKHEGIQDLALFKAHYHHLLEPPEDMNASRKFSYASVKEETCDGLPQSFESSLSSKDLEEVEWIAWPCTQWCKTKGLCSFHWGGSHDEHVQSRLEGYARSNPRKLEKILDELDKRRSAHKLFNLPFAKDILRVQPDPADFSLEVWREKLRDSVGLKELLLDGANDTAIDDSDDSFSQTSEIPQPVGTSLLESMPEEVLESIFSYVTVDHTSDPYARPHVDLAACALASPHLYYAAMRVMYRHVSIPQSKAFFKLMRTLSTTREQLGGMVRWLDFSHYSNMGFGNARTARNQVPYLKPETLRACLDMMPNLQAFLVHEHVDEELDANILSKLFNMPLMQALDFCACSSKPFVEAFTGVTTKLQGSLPALKRLSLHECTTLQEPVFEALLPRLPNLTHLDVAHTFINDAALASIPATARITHLNLERCTHLTGQGVVKFLTTHPAVKDTIVYLNLSTDASRHRLLNEENVSRLLASLPSTLRSLNLGGARVDASHIPALKRQVSHLEELGLRGANLSLTADIRRLFKMSSESENTSEDEAGAVSNSLFYLDLSDIRSVTQMALSYGPNSLLDRDTLPLEVIELGSDVLQEIKRRNAHVRKPEWVVKELGRRGWFVRLPPTIGEAEQQSQPAQPSDDGSRAWKMGARWWGMRKIPVVEQDVGGMYGYFMFKRS